MTAKAAPQTVSGAVSGTNPESTPEVEAKRTFTPRQLVILSGKGGTGKTTVAAALGSLASDKVLADCDVDAPDLHLLLDPKPVHREIFLAGKEARVLSERCCGCGLCAQHCRFDAIHPSVNGGNAGAPYVVDSMSCEGCGLCALACTSRAVKMIEIERGEWMISDTRLGPLVHARLAIGGENSGKLVTIVREQALALATDTQTGLVIIDGPPGVGCPAIASVAGADLVLAVTEPTVSGVHDLERLVALIRTFATPLAVCINKWDLNPDMTAEIERLCGTQQFEVVGRLPYDTAAVAAQLEGKSIAEHSDKLLVQNLRHAWAAIEDILDITEE